LLRALFELERLRNVLDYPPTVVETTITRLLERKTRQANPAEPDKEIKRFLKLLYVSKRCENFAFRLKQAFFPQIEFNVTFQVTMTKCKMFSFLLKNLILNALDQSEVVYRLKCLTCEAEYNGKTLARPSAFFAIGLMSTGTSQIQQSANIYISTKTIRLTSTVSKSSTQPTLL
jgi:hypothetical protein